MGSVLGGHHVLNEQCTSGDTTYKMGSVLGGHHVLNGQCTRGTPRIK